MSRPTYMDLPPWDRGAVLRPGRFLPPFSFLSSLHLPPPPRRCALHSLIYVPASTDGHNDQCAPTRWDITGTYCACGVGLGQPDNLGGKMERRAREGPQAGFESHADWNPGIDPVPSNSLVGHRIGRPMVCAMLH